MKEIKPAAVLTEEQVEKLAEATKAFAKLAEDCGVPLVLLAIGKGEGGFHTFGAVRADLTHFDLLENAGVVGGAFVQSMRAIKQATELQQLRNNGAKFPILN